MPCFLYFCPGETSGAGRDDEAGVTLRPELGVDHGDDDVDIGHATVGDPGLRAVEDPFVLGLVVLGGEPVAVDVGPGVWLRGGERTRVDLGAVAVALRHPLHDLLWGAGSGDAGGGETGAHDRHADTGVPQKISSIAMTMEMPVGSFIIISAMNSQL